MEIDMQYLSETVSTYRWERDGWWREYTHDKVEMDECSGEWYAFDGGGIVRPHEDVPAKWWAVAIYEEGQAYGGAEEGGWWYSVGHLVEQGKIRFFNDYDEAEAYHSEMWDLVNEWNRLSPGGDSRYIVMGLTEEMPPHGYPKKRPYYC
jgi:hypothetical protein